jgi:hypothetical protein
MDLQIPCFLEHLMQEHRWQSSGARPINVKEYVRELNAGSYNRYFEACLNSTLELIF